MKRNYPEKFVVKNPTAKYEWNVVRDGDEYAWTTVGNCLNIGNYTARYMDSLSGGYEFIFPEEAPQEPSLVFPFTVKHSSATTGGIYTITNGTERDRVDCYNVEFDSTTYDLWSYDQCKQFIKEGVWLVQSVGNQKPVELPSASETIVSALTINITTEAATEAMNALAEAIESVNIGLESMQKLMAEMGLGGKAREDYTDGSLVNCLVFGEFKETNG